MKHAVASLALVLSAPLAAAQAPCDRVVMEHLDAGPDTPVLLTPKGAPVVGGDFAFRVEQGPPEELVVMLYSGLEDPTFDPTLGATVFPQFPWFTVNFGTKPDGTSKLIFNTPSVPAELCGVQATFQAVVVDATAPGGLRLTNAVRMRVGEPGFYLFPRRSIGSSDRARSVLRIDLDGDGLADLVTPSRPSSPPTPESDVDVRLALAEGGFGPAASAATTAGMPFDLAGGDFDGDGLADLVTAEREGRASVLSGDGTGGFSSVLEVSTGSGSRACDVADFDGDGALDFVTANSFGTRLSVLLGDGLGGFASPKQILAGQNPYDVAVADVDEDGAVDLVATARDDDAVAVVLGRGNGNFDPVVQQAAGDGPWNLVVADLDGDTVLDVACTNVISEDVSVLLGQGGGALGVATSHPVGGVPYGIASVDVDADGLTDLLAGVEGTPNGVRALLADGAGGFAPATTSFVGVTPRPIVAFDVSDRAEGGESELVLLEGSPDTSTGTDGGGQVFVQARGGDGAFGGGYDLEVPAPVQGDPDLADFDLADLDGDGRLDVVVPAPNELSVRLGQEAVGELSLASPLASPHGVASYALALGDVDADGVPDALLAADDGLRTMLGAGDGTFAAPGAVTPGPNGHVLDAELVDLDGDAHPDAYLTVDEGSIASVLAARFQRGNGDGTFQAPTGTFFGGGTVRYAVGDMDGDGFLDLVVLQILAVLPPGASESALRVLLGDGTGGFALHYEDVDFLPLGQDRCAEQLDVVDVDRDGALDVLRRGFTSALSFSGVSHTLCVWEGLGDGTLGGKSSSTGASPGSDVPHALTDFDGDGLLDFVGVGPDGLASGTGSGGLDFASPARHVIGGVANVPKGLEIGDVDRDGIEDVAFLAEDGSGTTIRFLLDRLGE